MVEYVEPGNSWSGQCTYVFVPCGYCSIHMKLVILNIVQVDEGFPVSYDLCMFRDYYCSYPCQEDICKCNLFLLVPDLKCLEVFEG